MNRINNRQLNELRTLVFEPNINKYAEGSCLVSMGDTKVMVTATIEEKVPPFLEGKGKGWVTAEYSMLPRACKYRSQRESTKGHPNGRSQEIQRLIGRSLRSVVDLKMLGERTITIDCDVLQGDGGTRTASINGAFIALNIAINKLVDNEIISGNPIIHQVGAVSVGIIGGAEILDLNYEEDSNATVDMNIVMIDTGDFIEVQGTAEKDYFSRKQFDSLLNLAENGINEIFTAQKKVIDSLK